MQSIRALFTISLVSFILLSSAFAKPKKKTLNGYLVDISCATERSKELATLGVVHTKQCLQMPACVRSGYGLLTDDRKVIRFDQPGNEKVMMLVANAEQKSDFRIKVSGLLDGDSLQVRDVQLLP